MPHYNFLNGKILKITKTDELSKIKTKFQTIKGKFGERQVRYLTAGSGPVIFFITSITKKSADEYKSTDGDVVNDFLMIAPYYPWLWCF